jgi:hypothetical protein
MSRPIVSTLAILFGLAPSAQASTLPKVDFAAGQHMIALGLLDASYDYGLTDNLSIGVSSAGLLVPIAARATLQVLQIDRVTAGVTLSGGITPNMWGPNPWYTLPEPVSYWMQPALNVTYGLPEDDIKLRLTVGPLSLNGGFGPTPVWWFWPNAEVAHRRRQFAGGLAGRVLTAESKTPPAPNWMEGRRLGQRLITGCPGLPAPARSIRTGP